MHVEPGERRHGAYDLPDFDLQACFPRTDRDWGGDARLEAMWVAVSDAYPRIEECNTTRRFRHGEFDASLDLKLQVQPDHSVKLTWSSPTADPEYQACIGEALSMIDLPRSSEPSGQELESGYAGTYGGSSMLTLGGSKLGTIIGTLRTNTMDTCGCLERYRDEIPDDVKFKFSMRPGDPYAKEIRYVGDPDAADKELVMCLAEHLGQTPIADFGGELSASYRYKFSNSRAFDVTRMLTDASEARNLGDYVRATSLYDRVLAREPNNVEALRGLGVIALDQGEPQRARTHLERAHSIDGDDSTVLYDLGRAHADLGDPGEALEWYEASLEIEEDFRTHTAMAWALLELSEFGAARDHAQRSRELRPAYARAYIAEASALHRLGDSDEALTLLEQATDLDLEDVSSWNGLIVVYLDLERPDEAARMATLARKRGFDAAVLRYNEGVALQMLDQEAQASTAFCEAARLEPDRDDYRDSCERSRNP